MSNDDESYNGWPTYATWAVNLWLTNEQDTYNHWLAIAKREDTFTLADVLKAAHEKSNPLNIRRASVYSDLMNYALGKVDWYKIALSLKETVQENEEYERQADAKREHAARANNEDRLCANCERWIYSDSPLCGTCSAEGVVLCYTCKMPTTNESGFCDRCLAANMS